MSIMILQNLPQVISAIVGMGIAAFGLLDASKSVFSSIDRIGFKHIRQMVAELTPEGAHPRVNTLPQASILKSLEGNWANGTTLTNQEAIARSLINLHLSEDNAVELAARTNLDPDVLTQVAVSMASGIPLTLQQTYVYERFDKSIAALLDGAYQASDRAYRNGMRTLAACVAMVLAQLAVRSIVGSLEYSEMFEGLFVGLGAATIAPVAKDVSTAVSAVVKKKLQSYL
jgi:hypothetical protein